MNNDKYYKHSKTSKKKFRSFYALLYHGCALFFELMHAGIEVYVLHGELIKTYHFVEQAADDVIRCLDRSKILAKSQVLLNNMQTPSM